MPVYNVTYYVCSRCRHKEEAGEMKAGYGATTSCAPSGWTRAGFHPNATNDLCVECTKGLVEWLKPREERGL